MQPAYARTSTAPWTGCLLMAMSGFASLGYQMVWTRQLGTWLGHEITAALAVVAAFFGGLAIGAWLLGRRIAVSHRAAQWYVACEIVIAFWGGALTLWLPEAAGWFARIAGAEPSGVRHWLVAFGGPLLVLLPATAAMGATLPAMERVIARLRDDGYGIGALYGANTAGAVAGVLVATFVLMPLIGLADTARLCAAFNLLCAALAWWTFARHATQTPVMSDVVSRSERHPGQRRAIWLLFATGALGIGYEVVVLRMLAQLTQDTVFTFAMLLATYLLGSAAGAVFYQARVARRRDSERVRDLLLASLATACIAGVVALHFGERMHGLILDTLGPGLGSAIAVETALAVAAFALPTFAMGALFSHLCVLARDAQIGFGPAIAVNTIGAALAPVVFGVLLVPTFGPRTVLIIIAASYVLLLPLRGWRSPTPWVPAAGAVIVASVLASTPPVTLPEGSKLVRYAEGVMGAVSVVEDADGVRLLRIDNHAQEGSNASFVGDARQAYLPLLLHPAPRRALFLGLGTGVTASAAAEDVTLQVDAVELLPEVVDAAPLFAAAIPPTSGFDRLRVVSGDARRYVRAEGSAYDVIVADLFHPARSGAGALYTAEHFKAIRTRLAPGGLFCQWLPLHQLDLATLRSIVSAFLVAYPSGAAILATNSLDTPVIGLVSRPDSPRFDPRAVQARVDGFALAPRLESTGLVDAFGVLGNLVAGPAALARFAADAPINTDDRPVVAHLAPRITYAPESQPRDRLVALLNEWHPDAAELIADGAPGTAADAVARLAAYWDARTRFIALGVAVRPSADPRTMLAQVRAPLLDLVRRSPDFRPAYDPLLRMAAALADADEGTAASLLDDLRSANPQRADAGALRARLHNR